MAATALEVAVSLDPGNVQRREQLADVYLQAGADHVDKAIAEHQWLIAHNPDRLASYRALAKLYGETGARDKRWCVAATLSFLRKADADLQAFYEEHRPREFRRRQARLQRRDLAEGRRTPTRIASSTRSSCCSGNFVAAAAAQQHQALGLRRKERVDVDRRRARRRRESCATSPRRWSSRRPTCSSATSEPQSLSLYNLQEKGVLTPALVIGRSGARAAGQRGRARVRDGQAAWRSCARSASCATRCRRRPRWTSRCARRWRWPASAIGNGAHNGEVDKLTAELRRQVPRPSRWSISWRWSGASWSSARGEVIDVQAWMGAADLTAARVGFALTQRSAGGGARDLDGAGRRPARCRPSSGSRTCSPTRSARTTSPSGRFLGLDLLSEYPAVAMAKQAQASRRRVVALGLALGSALGSRRRAAAARAAGRGAAARRRRAGAGQAVAGRRSAEGPPVTLLPAATARPFLELRPSRSRRSIGCSRTARRWRRAPCPLPVDPAGLRDMLLQQAGLAPEVAANLDLASPSGAAVVALDRPGDDRRW